MQFTPPLAARQGVLQHRRHSIILNKHLLLLPSQRTAVATAERHRCHSRATPLPQQSDTVATAE